jgi:flagellar hook protein FlgE
MPTSSYEPTNGKITVNVPSGPITIRIGKPMESGFLQQFAGDFTNLGSKADDGTAFGTLTNYKINDKGVLSANFSNGSSRPLYQVPVVNVINPAALVPQGQEAFAMSRESGSAYLWNSGDGPVGKVTGSTLMRSNVDVAQELTGLIETQRAYASNAKVVQTVDEMLQTTTEIKR